LIGPALRVAKNIDAVIPRFNQVSYSTARKVALGFGLVLSVSLVQAIEDDAIRNMRSLMNK